jgi:hypothetical protein
MDKINIVLTFVDILSRSCPGLGPFTSFLLPSELTEKAPNHS